MTLIQVGKPYPDPAMVAEESAGWHPHTNIVLEVADGLTPESATQLWDGARLWALATGPLIVLLVRLTDRSELEMPAYLQQGQNVPEWVTDDLASESRLSLTIVSVDHRTGNVVRVHVTTLSPHATRYIHRAAQAWQPLTAHEAQTAIANYQARFPTIKEAIQAAAVSTTLGTQ